MSRKWLIHLGSAASCLVWDSEAMATEVEPPEVEMHLQWLLRCLIRKLQPHFGAFLLLEMWPNDSLDSATVLLRKQDRAEEMWQTIQVRLPTLGFSEKLTLNFEDPSRRDP